MLRTLLPTSIVFSVATLLVAYASAAPDRDALVSRARDLGRRAATEVVLEDAVPFVPGTTERREARRNHPAINIEHVEIPTDGEPLLAWWARPTRGLVSKGLVIVLPGWKSNVGFALGQTDFLLNRGYRLFLVEDRANAYAGKKATEFKGFLKEDLADLDRVLAFVSARRGRGQTPLAMYGFSWGGVRALLSAASHPEIQAVIVDGAPASTTHHADMVFEEYMPPTARADPELRAVFRGAFDEQVRELLGYRPSEFDVLQAAARLAPRPLLVIHSADDDFVPMAAGESIFAAAKEPKEFLKGERFGHCLGMRRAPDVYIPAVVEFLEHALSPDSARRTEK